MPASIPASAVMDRAASLLNDTARTIFTYTNMLPYLQTAYDELQEELEQNNVPLTNETSSTIVVAVGKTDIGGSTGPSLPNDLIDVQNAWERTTGSTEDFEFMTRVEYLPEVTIASEAFGYYSWQDQTIQFLSVGATTSRDIKLDYIGAVFPAITGSSSAITLFNAKNVLAFRTAALAAEFIGENKSRADDLNGAAQMALDRMLNLATKGRQAIPVRRRPFMSSYKMNTSL